MANHAKIGDDQVDTVRRFVIDGLTDAEIGEFYHCKWLTVWKFRKRHGIRSDRRKRKLRGRTKRDPHKPPKPVTTSYTDTTGHTVTVCPARFAGGILPQKSIRIRLRSLST